MALIPYPRKLTDENINYILSNPDALSQKELAFKFNVVQQTISKILKRNKYANFQNQNRPRTSPPRPER